MPADTNTGPFRRQKMKRQLSLLLRRKNFLRSTWYKKEFWTWFPPEGSIWKPSQCNLLEASSPPRPPLSNGRRKTRTPWWDWHNDVFHSKGFTFLEGRIEEKKQNSTHSCQLSLPHTVVWHLSFLLKVSMKQSYSSAPMSPPTWGSNHRDPEGGTYPAAPAVFVSL